MLSSLTPQFFDTLVIVIIIFGLALCVVRLYADFTRPLPPDPFVDAKRSTQPAMSAVPSESSSSSSSETNS